MRARRDILKNAGQSMIVALLFVFVIMALVGSFICFLISHRNFTTHSKNHMVAQAMSESGIEYALHQLRYGNWLVLQKPFIFKSPEIDRKGRFELSVSEVNDGSMIEVRSVGRAKSGARTSLTATITNPSSILGYTLSVLNYDYGLREFDSDSVTTFGADGVAASGLIQELHTIPSLGEVDLLSVTDPAFAGVTIGSDYVVDDSGVPLSRTNDIPVEQGRYFLDYTSGRMSFSDKDAGRKICVIYDYIRRIPQTQPCTIALPYTPIRPGSDDIFGMQRVADVPQAARQYQPNYESGMFTFSERDAGAMVGVRYSFLGSRVTGPVRVNGDVELQNTNLLYLFASKGQRFSASGRISQGFGGKLMVWQDDGQFFEGRDAKDLVLEDAPQFGLPPIDMDRLRSRARLGGKDVKYYDNPNDIEFPELLEPVEADTSSSNDIQPRNLDWNEYMNKLYQDWLSIGNERWQGGVYVPPGNVVNLSSVAAQLSGKHGMVFAEGNIILTGAVPEGRNLMVVSNRNIYIADTISPPRSSSLMLVAEGNVCINLSQMQPRTAQPGPLAYYLNCVVYARRGTLAVIPGGGINNRGIFHGSFFINRQYSHSEWAKAFSSMEWLYDPSLARPPKLCPDLVHIVGVR